MNVGLPGTGLGGLFYLLTALLMPVCELFRTVQGTSSARRWVRVVKQTVLAGGILGGLWGTAWMMNHVVPRLVADAAALRTASHDVSHLLGITPTLWTFMILGGLLVAVELLHLLLICSTWLKRLFKLV